MNKFLKLPLFLGGVCLVFCTSLATIVNVCQPIIEEANATKEKLAYVSLYDGLDEETMDLFDVTNKDSIKDFKQIQKVVVIPHAETLSCVYSLTSKDPQSGTISFMVGIDLNYDHVDAYALIANNNSGYAKDYADDSKLEDVKGKLIKYGETGKKDDFYHAAGATKTDGVMKDAVDQAIKHYNHYKQDILDDYNEMLGGQENGETK